MNDRDEKGRFIKGHGVSDDMREKMKRTFFKKGSHINLGIIS